MLPTGDYAGFLAHTHSDPDTIIAGVGVLVRWLAPFPTQSRDKVTSIARGKQGLVVNVYTEPAWRRCGVARQLMQGVLRWAAISDIDSLVLHAAPDGRALYEQPGFAPTNEMRYSGAFPSRITGT